MSQTDLQLVLSRLEDLSASTEETNRLIKTQADQLATCARDIADLKVGNVALKGRVMVLENQSENTEVPNRGVPNTKLRNNRREHNQLQMGSDEAVNEAEVEISNKDDDEYDSAEEEVAFGSDFKGLKINEDKYINVLLLGETGVGKSTFINSIANYFHFSTYGQAEEAADLLVLIPSVISVVDKYRKQLQMHIGSSDKNEYQEVGESCTQQVKTYVFPIGNRGTKMRLIDSPGMGDTRGVHKDDENCENILGYLGQLEELHAICFLMRPTNTRITVLFEYCVKQILSRLEKSASNNIIFIFTNTKGTNYEPGETYGSLEKVIRKIEAQPPFVKIPLTFSSDNTPDNVFCLDNESFRTLASMKLGTEFSDEVKRSARESWEYSAKECWRMIAYIVGYDKHRPLPPHQISNSVSINEARRMIVHLTKPLADISQLISDNLRILQRHQDNLAMENQSLDEMKAKLYVPVVDLKLVDLDQPVTVCTQVNCAEFYQIRDLKKWHYKQRCHNPCHLDGVSKEVIGEPSLRNCHAMNDQGVCNECGCDYTVHMHIYYETETYDDTVEDDVVKSNISSKDVAIAEMKKLVIEINQKKDELEEEHETIVKSTAQFAHFLQNNAISPFNDVYKEYIKHLIDRERSLGRDADMNLIKSFEKMLRQYEEEKAAFDNCLKIVKGQKTSPVDVKTIFQSINKLFTLKHNGKKIKEIYDKQRSCKGAEFDANCEYVHPHSVAAPGKPNQQRSGVSKPPQSYSKGGSLAGSNSRGGSYSKGDKAETFNILLLGETGVGKSTLINSVANYLHYANFDEAERSRLLYVIPPSVSSFSRNGTHHTLTVGSDQNEFQQIGVSATQNVKSYIIPFGESKLRLIDSPGMGDTRGIFKDEENCDSLTQSLAQLGQIHAICFLMQPSVTRITAQFEYSIKQILSRLDKSAADNIVFVFTNSRGVNYAPSETLACLNKVLEKLPNTVPLTAFSLDNEAFRYLVRKEHGCDISKNAKKRCKESWQHSSNEVLDLVSHVKDLKPYKVNLEIHQTTRLTADLIEVLTTISKLISDDAQILKRQQQNMYIKKRNVKDLKAKLITTVISARKKSLRYPVTVCTKANKCAELFEQTWHYPVCHSNCYCTKSAQGLIGMPALRKCTAMDASTRNCRYCGCSFNHHMTVQYQTEKYLKKIPNQDVRFQLDNIQADISALNYSMKSLNRRQNLNRKEHDMVEKTTFQFVQYLKAHVICPINDSYEEYIKHLAIQQKSRGDDCDPKVLDQLEDKLKQFEKTRALIGEVWCEDETEISLDIHRDSIKRLCSLKRNGFRIERVHQKYVQSLRNIQIESRRKMESKEKPASIRVEKTSQHIETNAMWRSLSPERVSFVKENELSNQIEGKIASSSCYDEETREGEDEDAKTRYVFHCLLGRICNFIRNKEIASRHHVQINVKWTAVYPERVRFIKITSTLAPGR